MLKRLDQETIRILSGLIENGDAARFAILEANVSLNTIKAAANGKGVRPSTFKNIVEAVRSLNKCKAAG